MTDNEFRSCGFCNYEVEGPDAKTLLPLSREYAPGTDQPRDLCDFCYASLAAQRNRILGPTSDDQLAIDLATFMNMLRAEIRQGRQQPNG